MHLAGKSSERLARLPSDHLDISRIEAGKVEIREEVFAVQELLQSVSELFSTSAQSKRGLGTGHGPLRAAPARGGARPGSGRFVFNLVGNALEIHGSGLRARRNLRLFPPEAGIIAAFCFQHHGYGHRHPFGKTAKSIHALLSGGRCLRPQVPGCWAADKARISKAFGRAHGRTHHSGQRVRRGDGGPRRVPVLPLGMSESEASDRATVEDAEFLPAMRMLLAG